MMSKHIDLADALTQLSDERIEEALLLDSAEALAKAKSSEKALHARAGRPGLRKRLSLPLCAALCGALCAAISLAVILPLTLGRSGPHGGDPDGGKNPMQIDNPWVYVETAEEVCEALQVRLPELPRSKTVKSCALLSSDGASLSDAEMGDILFADGSRLSLRVIGSDRLDESEMDRLSGVYGAALTAKEQRGDVTVYHFKASDSSFAAWVDGGVYYWYEPTSPADWEQMISLLLPCS